ncbi:unnamed protein product [Rotaria sordida]|uniref:DUF6570 domain-containing protein n=1 Tax=Rotaria sordida TaxID=392033 RepID=A0A819TIK8_9BILA|nr:unnamed protein product [Rotaria sordida]
MPVLAGATCAICNVRTPIQQSKKVPLSKIPNIHLLKVSNELKNLITNGPSSLSQHLDSSSTAILQNIQIPSTFDSSLFHYDNGVVLYTNGLFQQNKGQIPKFSATNNMWLGDAFSELQGLTIQEEKLMSLYHHNSCTIKLHSPFHSTTIARTALKGNYITFLQNVPNIVNSLPLTLDDINLKNIAQLPEDDVPECIMSTMEQKISDEEIQSERIGYIPDPLSDPIERTTTDSIPISTSSESSSALNKLSHHIKTIGGRVMDSAYSHTALCTRIHALIYDQGLPSIFLTLNPADIHSPVALYFAGVKLDLDNIQMEQLMDNYKRAEIIASHPARCRNVDKLASAALSEAALALIPVAGETKSSLNRLRRETTPPLPKSSFFDVPDAYSVTINGTPFLFSDTLVRKKRVILFASDEQLLPRSWNTPPRLSRDNIYAALSTIDLTGLQQNIYGPNNIISTPLKEQFVSSILHVSALSNKLLQTPTRNQPTFVINASYNESKVIPACLQTPNSSSPNFASRFRADVVQLVEASNIHKHSDTCYKYWNTNKDDKKSCRMRMPRKLVPISTIDPDTVIAEAQIDNNAIDPVLLPAKHDVHGEYDMDDSNDLLELLGNLDEYTTAAVNTTRKTTENKYIEETIEAVENVGRFNHTNTYYQSSSDISIDRTNRQLIPFFCATSHLVQLHTKWQK